jgi:hypothetical protein
MSESVPQPRQARGASRPVAPAPLPHPEDRSAHASAHPPSASQLAWLKRGLDQPGGKLPLFDADGKKVDPRTIRRCLDVGWAEPWFTNPIKPDWLVCKLTASGRAVALRALRAEIRRAVRAAPPRLAPPPHPVKRG